MHRMVLALHTGSMRNSPTLRCRACKFRCSAIPSLPCHGTKLALQLTSAASSEPLLPNKHPSDSGSTNQSLLPDSGRLLVLQMPSLPLPLLLLRLWYGHSSGLLLPCI
jgi:hypothetical protein